LPNTTCSAAATTATSGPRAAAGWALARARGSKALSTGRWLTLRLLVAAWLSVAGANPAASMDIHAQVIGAMSVDHERRQGRRKRRSVPGTA
jgi:hypothetical protein